MYTMAYQNPIELRVTDKGMIEVLDGNERRIHIIRTAPEQPLEVPIEAPNIILNGWSRDGEASALTKGTLIKLTHGQYAFQNDKGVVWSSPEK